MNESTTTRRATRRTRRSVPQTPRQRRRSRPSKGRALQRLIVVCLALLSLLLMLTHGPTRSPHPQTSSRLPSELPPLVMQGGDPYIRALMRTISASEANDDSPYTILYGGQHFSDLSHHPGQCVKILVGPNQGNCTTAAGRYQFITTTWLEKARLYHPQPTKFLMWENYSFEPQYQDEVVYGWLSDPHAWGVDLSSLLRVGDLQQVLELLSGTWTSLGYGLEDNTMTQLLPDIYQKMLQEELSSAKTSQQSQARQPKRSPIFALFTQPSRQEAIQGSF